MLGSQGTYIKKFICYVWNQIGEVDATYYPNWMRALKTLAVVPMFIVDLIFMAMVLIRAVSERCLGVRKQLFVFSVLFSVRF